MSEATEDDRPPIGAERAKAFTDAVVAIAMTLLILPLMESVSEAAAAHENAAEWLPAHHGQLFSFVLSFVIIANFWLSHHRLFAGVERVTTRLLWLMFAWMLTIVWLPVPTAIVGQMSDEIEPVQVLLYIGTMILTCLSSMAIRIYLIRHTALHEVPIPRLRRGIAGETAMALLFAAAAAVMLLFPSLSYWPMLVLFLMRPVSAVTRRVLRAG